MCIKALLIKKKAYKMVLQSAKHEETTFFHAFIFVFIQYFIGAILSKKRYRNVHLDVLTLSLTLFFIFYF